MSNGTLVFAHRGSSGTHPENTLSAFQEAIDVKADGIELDVHLSKDSELIVIHDENVTRTTNGSGRIQNLMLEEIQALDAGSWFSPQFSDQHIPTLQEVLTLLETNHYRGILNIEIKTDKIEYKDIEKKIAQLMMSQKWQFDYLYSSFNLNSLERIHQYDPKAEKAYLFSKAKIALEKARRLNFIHTIHPRISILKTNPELSEQFPKPIRTWTVNRKSTMIFCFKHHVDAFHTDYPEFARQLRDEYQKNQN